MLLGRCNGGKHRRRRGKVDSTSVEIPEAFRLLLIRAPQIFENKRTFAKVLPGSGVAQVRVLAREMRVALR